MNKIIQGDCLQVLPTLPQPKLIFADPPDNLGVDYNGFKDAWPTEKDYLDWLFRLTNTALAAKPNSFWLSYYFKYDYGLKGMLWSHGVELGYTVKPFVWWYKFGQHNAHDCGSCFRPMLRFLRKLNPTLNPEAILEPSERLRTYEDDRANPAGRVPGDVWDGVWEAPRVCGTFKEKRTWHKNQHPKALLKRMVLLCTNKGDLIVDLFAGTGTMNRVCQETERDCIGIDISEFYCQKIAEETGAQLEVFRG